jgi:hypothetical protein
MGIAAFGAFLFFGAAMALFAAVTLLFPGTFLDKAWALNPVAHRQLALIGRPVALLFLLLSAALAIAGLGWLRRRRWGWLLAVVIIAIQFAGDLGNAFLGQPLRGAVGAAIAGALLFYLLTPQVREGFE